MVDKALYNEHIKPANAAEVISDIQAKADAGIIMGVALHCIGSAFYSLIRYSLDPGSVHVIRIIPQGNTQKMDTGIIGYAQVKQARQEGKLDAALESAF